MPPSYRHRRLSRVPPSLAVALAFRHSARFMSDRDANSTYKWVVVAMLWTIVFFNYADRQALSAVIPLIRGELHLSPHEEGIICAAFAWVYGLCSPFAGRLVDRIRRRTAILGGLQIWSVICAATALAPGFGALVAFRAAEGLGE